MKKKIRVLEVIRQGKIGGGETHMMELVRHLDTGSYEPIVLSFTHGPMVKRLKELSIDCQVIETEYPFNFLVWKSVSDLIKTHDIDIVHAHGTRAMTNVFASARQLNKSLVYTVHGWSFHNDLNDLVRRMRIASEKFLTQRADQVINVSLADQNAGLRLIKGFRSTVIFNGINTEIFNPDNSFDDIRQELYIPGDRLLIGFIARLTKQKDPLTLLRAFRISLQKCDTLHLVMVGDGELLPACTSFVQEYGLEQYVTFTGFRQDIPAILKALDMYCLPSLWEGLPIGLLEAMAMETPCIASDIDGNNEIIRHEQNGLLFEHSDSAALSRHILALQQQPSFRHELAMQGRTSVHNVFDVVKMTRATEQVYEHAMKGRKINR